VRKLVVQGWGQRTGNLLRKTGESAPNPRRDAVPGAAVAPRVTSAASAQSRSQAAGASIAAAAGGPSRGYRVLSPGSSQAASRRTISRAPFWYAVRQTNSSAAALLPLPPGLDGCDGLPSACRGATCEPRQKTADLLSPSRNPGVGGDMNKLTLKVVTFSSISPVLAQARPDNRLQGMRGRPCFRPTKSSPPAPHP
jgi:hypothetical protein